MTCGCTPLENGDVPCHNCGEYVNVRCWKCRTPRGEGVCPNPLPWSDLRTDPLAEVQAIAKNIYERGK